MPTCRFCLWSIPAHRGTRISNANTSLFLNQRTALHVSLNLHARDVAHALMLGATGAGKSFAASTLLQSAQKYEPLTFVFDLGGSYEVLTRAFGGTYLNVGLRNPGFSINPFSLEPTHESLNFLYLFLRVRIESGGRHELSTADEKALYAALERIYKLPREIRTLTNFAFILGPLGERLHRWTQSGSQGTRQFGYLRRSQQRSTNLHPYHLNERGSIR